jgi:type IV secretion system protein VirB11
MTDVAKVNDGERRRVDTRSPLAVMTSRQTRMLHTAMGEAIAAALEDPEVVEILLNPDGTLWFDRLDTGRRRSGICLTREDGDRIIRLVAAHLRLEVHPGAPIISAVLPETGERFEGVLPPIVRGPTFSIRKRTAGVIPLTKYVADEVLTESQALVLQEAVRERKNILIAGGTSTGKTTLANALLLEIALTGDRVLMLEDTVELQCRADDHVPLQTRRGLASMADLVRSALRLRPDRIVVGEVRGGEALDLLKAWGTGHPGGIATLHAGSARGALTRLEQLIQEVVVTVPQALIAESVDLIVFLAGRGRARRVEELMRVTGFDAQGYHLEPAFPHFTAHRQGNRS